jgi:hypothetical protein
MRNPLKYTSGGNIKKSWKRRNKDKMYDLGTFLQIAQQSQECASAPAKKEKNMNRAAEVNLDVSIGAQQNQTEQEQRKYLRQRLRDATYELDQKAQRQFGLIPPESPETMDEWIERIQKNKFTIKDEHRKSQPWNGYISWFEPGHKEDKEGYLKAQKAMEKAHKDTLDIIVIKTPAEGLAAVQAFENHAHK